MRFALFLLSAAVCCACKCAGPPLPLGAWQSSEFVFLGTVTRIDPPHADSDPETAAQAVHVAVIEAFKGTGDRREFVLRQQFHSCALQFDVADRAVFYLSPDEDGSLRASVCGSTRLAEYAENDLAFLRALPQSAKFNRLSGSVNLYADAPAKGNRTVRPLAGIEVTITGPKQRVTTSTDANGVYAHSGLPAGIYEVSIAEPPNLKVTSKSVHSGFIPRPGEGGLIKLDSNSHVRVSFDLYEDTSISGRVLGPNGAPLHQVCVQLQPVDEDVEEHRNVDCTSADGRYELKRMLSGSYRVTVAKGIAAKAQSQVVTVHAGTPLTGVDFRIPKLAPRVVLTGRVKHADGRPAKGASVTLSDSNSDYTNAAGEFRIVAEASETGHVIASNPDCRDAASIPLAIAPNKDLANILLTVPSCK